METLLQDLRHGARMLMKNPGFTAVAVVTLALGIGANTAIFSVVNAVVLRPLPYEESERLVFVTERSQQMDGLSVSWPNYSDWRERNRVFEHIGVYNRSDYNLTENGEPERLQAGQVTADLFDVLRVKAALGRVFTADEDKPGAEPVVVLSYGLWQRRFGGDPGIINRTIRLNDRSYTVIGVMPAGYEFPSRVELWVSSGRLSDSALWQNRGSHPGLNGVARLKHGVTIEQARADMETIAAALEQQFPESNQGHSVSIIPLKEQIVNGRTNVSSALWVLLCAVGCVLLIACTNVANLLLARASVRQREIAVRIALGASRWRVVRQLLTESVLLAMVGGAQGVLVAYWGVDLILTVSPGLIPRASEIKIDGGVLTFMALVSIITGIAFGLVPALQASKARLHIALKESGRSLAAGRHWARSALVVLQTALTLVLLVGAGLLIRSFHQLQQVNTGFAYDRLLSFSVSLPDSKYPAHEQKINFYKQLTDNLQSLPGVESVGLTSGLPLGYNGWQTKLVIEGRPLPPLSERPAVDTTLASPEYFRAMGIPLLEGRWFNEQDNRNHLNGKDMGGYTEGEKFAAGVNAVIIDEEFARRYWTKETAVGQHIRLFGDLTDPKTPVATVVGVVGRVKMDGLSAESNRIQAYVPFYQFPFAGMTVVVKSAMEPNQLITDARRQVQRLDANQPIYNVETLENIRSHSVAPERLNLTLLGLLAALALILALVGTYSVMTYTVTQRTHEIGIRMALGAQMGDVLRLVVGQGIKLTSIGIVLGLAGSFALTSLMSSLLFGVTAKDPITFTSVTLLLVIVSLLACYLPARRASKVNPVIALRCE